MDSKFSICKGVLLTLLVPLTVAIPQRTMAQEEAIEEIVTTGTRRAARSVTESAVPIDVISGADFLAQGNTDINALLSAAIPSYNVNSQPISDAATIVRPANLRGLSPDSTLILINGKRMHRSAVISFLGGGIADGSQGPDISNIPGLALKQIEVLRDGASAQYGSDAIAGVINFVLKDNSEGLIVEGRFGEFFEGDGASSQIGFNIGMPLTDDGFFNVTAEFKDVDPTSRSVQRDDAQGLIDAGNSDVRTPAAQIWGTPEVTDDFKIWVNAGLDLGNGRDAYVFANCAERDVEGGFFFRNPNTRGGINDGGTNAAGESILLIADLTFGPSDDGVGCPEVVISNNVPDPAALAAVDADPNCWAFNLLEPGGFTPQFGGHVEDASITAGTRGEFSNGLLYDFSASFGRNQVDYVISNTVNPQLAAQQLTMPRRFTPGSYVQSERNVNADFSYPVDFANFASPLNVAFGLEYRVEQFEIKSGGPNSFFIDNQADLAAQGFGIGSNGFPGFKPEDAGVFDRGSFAAYIDLEADVTDNFLLGFAVRFEDFGTTTDVKLAARFQITEGFAIRGAASTGFRAPTVGQTNVRNVTTAFTNGVLADEATLPPTNPIAAQKGGVPLEPEESVSLTVGFIANFGAFDVTVDYFNIEVTDRLALTTTQILTPQDVQDLLDLGIADASSFTGVRFFTNDFDTTTQGIDIVATTSAELFGGDTNFSFTYNWTDTEVDSFNPAIIGDTRVRQLEDNLPDQRFALTANHVQGDWRVLLRLNYFGEYFEAHLDDGTLPIEVGQEMTVDAEIGYNFTDSLSVTLGAQNLFDEFPDKNPWSGIVGAVYPVTSPMGFNGGFWYLRATYTMN
ncbi:MAG: TonB-dependent receptor [Proteobacteria bacterium]|nr:TonB-dependent receptor [Pseudomonadota bacterium]